MMRHHPHGSPFVLRGAFPYYAYRSIQKTRVEIQTRIG